MNTAIRNLGKVFILSVLVCFLFLAFGSAVQAKVIQMDRQEVIQRSNMIFVGSVLEKNARWNEQGNLIVTDYVFEVDDVLLGEVGSNQLTLTFAGGQLAEEGQSVSDVPEFEMGDLALLMIEESDYPLFSPVTGGYQGKFVARTMENSGEQVVGQAGLSNLVAFDGKNQAVRNDSGDVIAFDDFVEKVRNEIPVAKSRALPDRSVPQELESLVIKDLSSKVYDPSSVQSSMSSETTEALLPASIAENNGVAPEKNTEVDLGDDGLDVEVGKGEGYEDYNFAHLSTSRIVFNPMPTSSSVYPHDQYMMSYWNKYGDIFRVMTPTGTWAWRNGRYDIAGWPSNATMISQFGSGWGSSTLAVCWSRWNSSGNRIEADVAMNPAFSWTLNDYSTYSNGSVWNIHNTWLHEIGHAWGAGHEWYRLSVMNYSPKKYRAYARLYVDDVVGIRAAYPYDVARSDYGVHGYHYASYRNYDDANVSPTTVNAGSTVSVSNFIIDNTGTSTVSPRIEWYLVPNMVSWSGNRYIGTTTHSSLARNSYFTSSRTLTIPSDTPAGNYYLAAYIRSDSVSNNNETWIDRRITVVRAALGANVVSLWPVGTKKQGETATLWARVQNTGGSTLPSSARVYYQVVGPGGLNSYVGWASVGGLAPGGLQWYSYNWSIPANRTPGTHNYYARVWNTATGQWLGAGSGPQSFTVVAGLSADVTSLWPVGTKRQGETASLWARVQNTGGTTLPAAARVYYQVAGPGLNSYVGWASVGGLAPGDSRWYEFKWAIPANRTPGTHNYWAQVWNTATGTWLGARQGPQSFTVVAGAGLSADVTSLWPPGNRVCGTTTPLWARVQNTGGFTLPSSARVYYQVAGPGLNSYVGWASVGGLAPGDSRWYEFKWAIPANRTPGTHNYWAQVWNTATGTWLGARQGPQSFAITCGATCRSFSELFNGGTAPMWRRDRGIWNVVSNAYYFTYGLSGYSSTSTYNQTCRNFNYTARLWRNGSSTANANRLWVRASGSVLSTGWYQNAYTFQYSSSGMFSVYRVVNGSVTALRSWTSSSAINRGSAWNLLRVYASGSSFWFYINNRLVWSGSDSSLSSGREGVGMYRSSGSTGNGFWVDYATLTASDGEADVPDETVSDEQQQLNDAADENPIGNVNSAE
jgi:hypothetical protein